MKIAHLNCRSLLPSLNSIKQLLETYDFDIMTLSETWLKNIVYDKFLTIPGYTFFRKNRVIKVGGKESGGGLLIYIKSKFSDKAKEIDFDSYCGVANTIEVRCIMMNLPTPIAIINVYKPPTNV